MKENITLDDIKKHKLALSIIVAIIMTPTAMYFIHDTDPIDTVSNEDYINEIRYEASRYNPTLSGYNSDKIQAQVYIINKNNDCGDLKKLFERNSDWWSLPMLADKIERICFNNI